MFGVGVIGAGPGAEALHVPLMAARTGLRVVHVSDAGSGRAAGLAHKAGARHSVGVDALLADEDVQVVVICSPPSEHAEQILAAVRAGVIGIFCEKPLAMSADAAREVIEVCRQAGVALTVGAHHRYDGASERVLHHLIGLRGHVRTVTVTASLPPNTAYHRAVSVPEPGGVPGARDAPDLSNPAIAAGMVRRLILGLLVHDLPLVRDLMPRVDEVVYARALPPVGLALGVRGADAVAQFTAVLHPSGADALWRMSIATDADVIDIDHPPAFIDAGSALVTVRHGDGRETRYAQATANGYQRQWDAFEALLNGAAVTEYDELLADALYAVDLADRAAVLIGDEQS